MLDSGRMDSDPFPTQRDVGSAVVTELSAAGFADAEEIGRGGFGIVFRCSQVKLDRVVAVKVLTTELREDRERFLREQRAMATLTGHPNIVGGTAGRRNHKRLPVSGDAVPRAGVAAGEDPAVGSAADGRGAAVGVKMAGALETAHPLGNSAP